MHPTAQTNPHPPRRGRAWRGALVAAVALGLAGAVATAEAAPPQRSAKPARHGKHAQPLSLDIGAALGPIVPPLTAPIPLPGRSVVLASSVAPATSADGDAADGTLSVVGEALAADAARFSEMLGSHRIEWRYDESWSSSLGSDYPKFRSPSFFVGNGSPGVNQKVWVRFSLLRRF